MAVAILWLATVVIAIAQTMQVRTLLRTRSADGISISSEAINAIASCGLLIYAVHLGDAPLIISRCVLAILWLARLGLCAYFGWPKVRLVGARREM